MVRTCTSFLLLKINASSHSHPKITSRATSQFNPDPSKSHLPLSQFKQNFLFLLLCPLGVGGEFSEAICHSSERESCVACAESQETALAQGSSPGRSVFHGTRLNKAPACRTPWFYCFYWHNALLQWSPAQAVWERPSRSMDTCHRLKWLPIPPGEEGNDFEDLKSAPSSFPGIDGTEPSLTTLRPHQLCACDQRLLQGQEQYCAWTYILVKER